MTLRQLFCFRQVVINRFDMTAASQAVYKATARSSVGEELQALTEELGAELFVRNGNRLVGLTDYGKQVDELAERMLRDADTIRAIGRTAWQKEKIRLTVVATRHTANANVRRAVLEFQRMHPKALIRVSEEQPETACKMVSAGEAEIGIVPERDVDGTRLSAIPLEHWRLVIVVPQKHKLLEIPEISLEALADVPLACYERKSAARRAVEEAFASAGFRAPVAFELSSSEEILDYVESGANVGIVAESTVVAARHPRLRVLVANDLFPPLTTSIITRLPESLSWATKSFVELLLGQGNRIDAS